MDEQINVAVAEKLFNRDFLLLWFGQIVSSVGNSVQYIAVMWWIMENFPAKESGIVMGWMFAFNVIPIAVLSPFAGVFVDRVSRKAIVVLSDVSRGILILWMAYLAYSGQLTILWIYTISALGGIGWAFFNPTIQSTLPNIVPGRHLTRANGMYQTGMQFTNIVGPALGGILVGFFGPFFVFALNGLSFLFSAVTELFINFRQTFKEKHEANSFFLDFKEGMRYVYGQKFILWALVIVAVLNFAFAPIDILIAKQIKTVYGLGALELGYVISALGIGMITGSAILSILPEFKKRHTPIFIGLLLIGVFFAAMGMAPGLVSFLIAALAMGFVLSIANVLFMVVLQKIVPDEKRGRVFSVVTMSGTVLQPVSLALMGFVSGVVANSVIFFVLGVTIAVLAWCMRFVPGFNEI